MSVRTVSKRGDIDFNKHLIELKEKRDKAVENYKECDAIYRFYMEGDFDQYSILSEIQHMRNHYQDLIDGYNKQMVCSHEHIDFDKYVGSDSHKDYYETKCVECGLIFDRYDG